MKDLRDDFRASINHSYFEPDEITARECSSELYSGVEYKLYGEWIPVRPIIDAVAKVDDYRIQNIGMSNEGEEAALVVFVAYVPSSEHPAFTAKYE